MKAFDIQNAIDTVEEFGYIKIPDFLSALEVEQVTQEYNAILNKEDFHKPYSLGLLSVVNRPKEQLGSYPKILATFYNKYFKVFARTFFNSKVELNEEIFFAKDVVGSKHIANDLHFDIQHTLKFFLYLNDVGPENGAFIGVPKSHVWTREFRKTTKDEISYENRDISRDLPNLGEEVSITGKAGTLIIFDTDMFHRGGTVEAGERCVMRSHTRKRPRPLKSRVINSLRGLRRSFLSSISAN